MMIDTHFQNISKAINSHFHGEASSLISHRIYNALLYIKDMTAVDHEKALVKDDHIKILERIPSCLMCSNAKYAAQICVNIFTLWLLPIKIDKESNKILCIKNLLIKKYHIPFVNHRFLNSNSFFKYWENDLLQGCSLLDSVSIVKLSLVSRHMQARCCIIWSIVRNPLFFKVPQLERIFPCSVPSEHLLNYSLQKNITNLALMVTCRFINESCNARLEISKILLNFIDKSESLLKFHLSHATEKEFFSFLDYLMDYQPDLNMEKIINILNEAGTHLELYDFVLERYLKSSGNSTYWVRKIGFHRYAFVNPPGKPIFMWFKIPE